MHIEDILKNIMKFGENVSYKIKKEFLSESVFNKKYLKTKIKFCYGKINSNFHNNKIPEEDSQCIVLLIVLINSVERTDNNYYPQVFLE